MMQDHGIFDRKAVAGEFWAAREFTDPKGFAETRHGEARALVNLVAQAAEAVGYKLENIKDGNGIRWTAPAHADDEHHPAWCSLFAEDGKFFVRGAVWLRPVAGQTERIDRISEDVEFRFDPQTSTFFAVNIHSQRLDPVKLLATKFAEAMSDVAAKSDGREGPKRRK